MSWLTPQLWIIPALPLVAAGILAVAPARRRRFASWLSIGAMAASCLVSCVAFIATLQNPAPEYFNFRWFQAGQYWVSLGWILDPLAAAMLVMVSLVGTLIFIYSTAYMAADGNYTRFFCFLSLFAAAMLGLVIANSLLLLFICWELVGLASYLLIGFWYQRPSAAAAAKKAFLVTRIGDLGLFLGMVWLNAGTGTLVFYDGGQGCLEANALAGLAGQPGFWGVTAVTAIGLLLFWGAVGKSGQVPLHVWLPDAMEGPTPVSALIHAATMVAAGVFLIARMFPLLEVDAAGIPARSTTLAVITWTGSITAVFAACLAVAQKDIKRILAYSTISQLGYMMLGLGTGGVAVGMFHLITHAFFKALLFLGAGSVIHGCAEEQDVFRLGGLRRLMPVTFATYAIGMMALAGVPLVFSGFWSKDAILHNALGWAVSRIPFMLGLTGAFLTAFYMTRQIAYVFFGQYRGNGHPHEAPGAMTVPLVVLGAATLLLSFVGTPFWPWFQAYLTRPGNLLHQGHLDAASWWVMILSTAFVAAGILLAIRIYKGRTAMGTDPLRNVQPDLYTAFERTFWIDQLYALSVVRLNTLAATLCDRLDRYVWSLAVEALGWAVWVASWGQRLTDEFLVNLGFDRGCASLKRMALGLSCWQNGRPHRYLRAIAVSLVLLGLGLLWGCRR